MRYAIEYIEWDTSDFSEEEELASGCCVPDLPSDVVLDEDEVGMDMCDCHFYDKIDDILFKRYGHEPLDYSIETML